MLPGLQSLAFSLPLVLAPKWCGKLYLTDKIIDPPGGQFPVPASLDAPHLALRCNPALVPFLPDDNDPTNPSSSVILVDALVRTTNIKGAQPLGPASPSQDTELLVNVFVDGKDLTSGKVPLNGSAALPFSLSKISTRTEPYNLTCTATLPQTSSPQTFESIPAHLSYFPFPDPSIGSITKLDLRTGGLLAKRANDSTLYEPIFPMGFYTSFGGYLEGNISILEDIKHQGFNVVHPIPPCDNLTAFDLMVDKMEELGLWLMYDMRHDYQNLTSVKEQVMRIKNRTNLLLYYTADEPDGPGHPLSDPASAAATIKALDPYRPSSLVLSCQDYFFADYAEGTPILIQDTYPIGINATYSVIWNTSCTRIVGDCGCDNCRGDFEDIRDRMEDFGGRLEVLGWERSKTIWTVSQAFGASEYWSRVPTGAEFLVETIVAINAGAKGSVSWIDPTTPDIKASASAFARALPELTPFLLSSELTQPPVNFTHVVTRNRLDFGVWASTDGRTLVMGTNLNDVNANIPLCEVVSTANLSVAALGSPRVVLDGGSSIDGSQIRFGKLGSGAWIFEYHQHPWMPGVHHISGVDVGSLGDRIMVVQDLYDEG